MRILGLLLLLAGCTEQAPPAKAKQADDGCYAYIIRPDGAKDCMRCAACKAQP